MERARMSSPLAAVCLSIASDGSSSTVDPSVDTSSPLRRHLTWIVYRDDEQLQTAAAKMRNDLLTKDWVAPGWRGALIADA